MTTFTKHTFPGLPNPVYLPDWIIVEFRIIPSSVWGWTSGQYVNPANFTSTSWHDTDNDSSDALGEWSWANGGGRGRLGSDGSYNGIFDGKRLIITQRFDELVGHAANHTGNVTSYAFEQAYGRAGGNSFDASYQVGLWVHAGVLQAMGKLADTSMYQHYFWSMKNCPKQIRNRNLWSATERGVDDRIAQIKAFILGSELGEVVKPPVPLYPAPSRIPVLDAVSSADVVAPSFVVIPGDDPITAFFVGDRYEAIRDTPRNQFAYKGSPVLNAPIRKGESFDIDFVFENAEGQWGYTPYGTRVNLADLKRVSDTKGAEAA